ncbi:MAG: 4-(cytidine 5'-diphospho)-2-C-methyl-D-erythritol kinase [Candidatus Eremiobacteraeota bacterium]|nr:4-(cytidine 5'-diphospho)-2-C-methyl-D-erythritol kinase [Candidatus Eremiobacteraeota bacterium]
MTIVCPAKINLTLEVLDRRADGYHGIRSVMVPLELADELTIESSSQFVFRCSDQQIETENNLAVRAARAVAPQLPVALTLEKRVPMQAGLGGGSSDAAAILLAAMRGAFGKIDGVDWVAVARKLGSDVPFFLVESGALVEATGERVTAIGALPAWHVLIVKPPSAVSTAAAYAQLDATPRPSRPRSSSVSLEMVEAIQRGDFTRARTLLSNDFNDVIAGAVHEVAQALDALARAGATRPLLSGSGSAVFALEESADAIAEIEARLDLPREFTRIPTAFRRSGTWRA